VPPEIDFFGLSLQKIHGGKELRFERVLGLVGPFGANPASRNVESLNKTLHIGAQGSLTAVN
jgi:hypothetical protein